MSRYHFQKFPYNHQQSPNNNSSDRTFHSYLHSVLPLSSTFPLPIEQKYSILEIMTPQQYTINDMKLRHSRLHQQNATSHASHPRDLVQRSASRYWETVLGTSVSPIRMDTSPTRRIPAPALMGDWKTGRKAGTPSGPSPDPTLKKFVCAICGVSFCQKGHMKQHVRTVHQRQRPFKCEQCDGAFAKRHDLACHIDAVHFKERPHCCTFCSKSFAKRWNLVRHVATLHADLSSGLQSRHTVKSPE